MASRNALPEALEDWLQGPFGSALVAEEARLVEEALDGVFGVQCLQLGQWGEARTFLRHARTQHTALVAEQPVSDAPAAIGRLHRLPVASDSIDAVLLPHTLDYIDRPHEVLREVDRVLRSDGHVIILGFRPGGLWGLRRLVPGAELPPGAQDLISDRRLSDWLKLLDMRIEGNVRYFFRWPFSGNRGRSSPRWESRGQRWWPELSACYMLAAQKRVSTLTPVRPRWRQKPKVVAGLAEPTTRVSRIRFNPNS